METLRPLVVALLLQGVVAGGIHRDFTSIKSSYDYIIAGGGLTGLVVANRLTEDANTTVLVVEYGDFDDSWNTAMPYYGGMLQSDAIQFRNPYGPQKHLNNRNFTLSQGAVVGGGTTVNGMAMTRGGRLDYDIWDALQGAGDTRWRWDDLLPYFEKAHHLNTDNTTAIQTYNYTFGQTGWGNGPVQAYWPTWQYPDTYVMNEAWNELGYQFRPDAGTSGNNVGIIWKPIAADAKNVTRSSSRTAYYNPASKRPNLDLLIGAYVARVNFKNDTATGVKIMARELGLRNQTAQLTVSSNKEVILAAGATHTPMILQLSGIGPADLLKEFDIPVVQDLPGVGANLQDHPRTSMSFEFKKQSPINSTLLDNANSSSFKAYMAEYMSTRTGPMTISHGNTMAALSLQNLTASHAALLKSLSELNPLDFAPASYKSHPHLAKGYAAQAALYGQQVASGVGLYEYAWGGGDAHLGMMLLKPLSRGTLHIRSTDPHPGRSQPVVDYNALAHPFDMQVAVLAVRTARRLMGTKAAAKLQPVELAPGGNYSSDVEIEEVLRGKLLGPDDANPCGTAAMMARELGGVVDAELRVYGVHRLRVVDSSIVPVSPAAHLQVSLYAVAERAADLIKKGMGQ